MTPIDRTLAEQASAAAQLTAGHPDVRGLRQAVTDWVMEEVLIGKPQDIRKKLLAVPVTLRQANDFVLAYHRHNGPTARDGGKFAIGCSDGDGLVGVAIVGMPLARLLNDGWTAEVLRTCAGPNAPKNVNSFLYARCWQAWHAMGGHRLVTYTLTTESGASLRGAGWRVVAKTEPGGWHRAGRYREWEDIYGQVKFRWEVSE